MVLLRQGWASMQVGPQRVPIRLLSGTHKQGSWLCRIRAAQIPVQHAHVEEHVYSTPYWVQCEGPVDELAVPCIFDRHSHVPYRTQYGLLLVCKSTWTPRSLQTVNMTAMSNPAVQACHHQTDFEILQFNICSDPQTVPCHFQNTTTRLTLSPGWIRDD